LNAASLLFFLFVEKPLVQAGVNALLENGKHSTPTTMLRRKNKAIS
jgi:hypothetical protein